MVMFWFARGHVRSIATIAERFMYVQVSEEVADKALQRNRSGNMSSK